ncbi:MAG: HEAT repeat domain-containing protein [Chloroflexota bacterium]
MTSFEPYVAALLAPVSPENEKQQEATAIALGQYGSSALPAINQLLHADNVDGRFWAIRSLWAWGDETAQALLVDLLTDKEAMIRSGAAFALGELQSASAIPHLMRLLVEDEGATGDHAADALAKIGQASAPVLINALADKKPGVRIRAIRALTPLESHQAIAALIQCLDHDPSYIVRHYANIALKRMGVGEMVYFR